MFILNCTKAAADFFSTTKKGKKTSPLEPTPKQSISESISQSITDAQATANTPPQWHWLVHAIKVKGKNVLIAMDCQTRFSITLYNLKKADDGTFLTTLEQHLTVHVHEQMVSVGADSQAIDDSMARYFQQHTRRALYLRGDRSLQAHINDVAWHFKCWADDLDSMPQAVDLIGHDTFVNQLLRKRLAEKDYFYPQREFLRSWLKHYAVYTAAQADHCIDILEAKDRAEFAASHPNLVTPNLVTPNSLLNASSQIDNSLPALTAQTSDTELASNVISLDAYRKKKQLRH